MSNFYKLCLFFICLIGISTAGFSQSNEIKITFLGNCGLYLTDGSSNLYIDFPYKSGAYNYMKYDPSEITNIKENSIFLFTHRHADHYSKKILKQIKGKHNGRVFGNWNIKKFAKLTNSLNDFKIETFKTKHRFTFKHYSYLITWHGKKIFLSGDTETSETITTIKEMDWAFVPYWIILDANEKKVKIDTKKIGLYHLYPDQKVNNSKPEKVILLNKQGEVIRIEY
ncbi:MAG TPA: MBL fold metallo-hydrolase [Chitinophagaceae bacterium]|nr:MBL fold metallo-hydrolase [Chitinophagaceae bacterium]